MKKLIPTIAIAICSIWLVSCSNAVKNVSEVPPTTSTDPVVSPISDQVNPDAAKKATTDSPIQIKSISTPTKVATNPKGTATTQPKVGTIKEMVSGDLKCYVTLLDEAGKKINVGATFEICEQKTFLNKKVQLVYKVLPVNDCQSAEPCGKTRQESLITKMELVGDSPKPDKSNSQTISNGEWTITIGNRDSWSGVNGTGNLTYSGCDNKGNCVKINGGQVVCRDGICTTGWSNKGYDYIIKQAISADDSDSSTTLTVRKGATIILNASGFKAA